MSFQIVLRARTANNHPVAIMASIMCRTTTANDKLQPACARSGYTYGTMMMHANVMAGSLIRRGFNDRLFFLILSRIFGLVIFVTNK
eukprot:scaffold132098_cov36-Prasinocladus_malaysianus.AAC.1